MRHYTVQCSYPIYYVQSVTVEADTLDAALDKAICTVNDTGDGWKSLDNPGDTFVDALAEGEHESPWGADQRPVPHRFTELGVLTRSHRPPPDVQDHDRTIHVDVEQGVPVAAHLPEALHHVRLIVRDFDTEGRPAADLAELPTDERARPYWETDLTERP